MRRLLKLNPLVQALVLSVITGLGSLLLDIVARIFLVKFGPAYSIALVCRAFSYSIRLPELAAFFCFLPFHNMIDRGSSWTWCFYTLIALFTILQWFLCYMLVIGAVRYWQRQKRGKRDVA